MIDWLLEPHGIMGPGWVIVATLLMALALGLITAEYAIVPR